MSMPGGYSDSLSMAQAMDERTLLAVGMNGRVLPRAHGFPVRVLAVGTYGMKNPKWVTGIEVVDAPPVKRSIDAIRRKDAGSPGGVVHAFLQELELTLRARERRAVQLVV